MSEGAVYIPQIVPVFPLPEVVLFPRVILPLHIFEPRYREMAADALLTDKIIAMGLLKPGYQPLYHTRRAPIHSVLGVGRVLEAEQLADGKYNLLLQGVARARMMEEVGERSYRQARIEIVRAAALSETKVKRMRRALRRSIETHDLGDARRRDYWLELFDSDLDLDGLTDLIAGSLAAHADAEWLQCLLAEPSAAVRTELLAARLQTAATVQRRRREPPTNAAWNLN